MAMSISATPLISVYEEWRRETLAEGAAISAGDWENVAAAQARKILLRKKLESGSLAQVIGALGVDDEKLVRAFVAELIGLERSNDAALAAKRRESVEEMASMDAAAGNLRRVQRYGQPNESAWVAYS